MRKENKRMQMKKKGRGADGKEVEEEEADGKEEVEEDVKMSVWGRKRGSRRRGRIGRRSSKVESKKREGGLERRVFHTRLKAKYRGPPYPNISFMSSMCWKKKIIRWLIYSSMVDNVYVACITIIITKEWDFFFLSMSPWIVQSNKTWNSYYFSLWCLQKKRRWRSYLYITYANDVFAFIALSNFSVLPLSTIGFTMQFFSPFFEDILRNDATILFF